MTNYINPNNITLTQSDVDAISTIVDAKMTAERDATEQVEVLQAYRQAYTSLLNLLNAATLVALKCGLTISENYGCDEYDLCTACGGRLIDHDHSDEPSLFDRNGNQIR